jgi:hypothetical protein
MKLAKLDTNILSTFDRERPRAIETAKAGGGEARQAWWTPSRGAG